MRRHDFSLKTSISDAWRKLGVPTSNINQATRWHDNDAGVWTLWIENRNGVSFESPDKGETLVLTPWEPDLETHTKIHIAKARKYWEDLHAAAAERKTVRIMAIKWRKDSKGQFVSEQHGATIPVYWREMRAAMHEDGRRVVLTESVKAVAK